MTELPTTFGKYYLTEKLATGGMAEIFLGKLIGPGGFEKQLVIKQIHPALSDQRHFVDLFVAEAKTLVGLAHGNIVPLYELGVIDDTYFIAMEYIDGPTLWRLTEAVFRRGDALAPGLALHIAAELAKGLDYAHRKGPGVIHRDLSPRNVMLSRDGEVKLVDFGIAVTFGGGEDTRGDDAMPTGSFPYMSPEQVARRPLSGQSDLFSLGVLLWEMLAGERLFARASPEETLAAVTGAPIPAPSTRRPTVAPALDAVVLRCLERDPAARWRDAGELASALNRALYTLDVVPGARDVAAVVARYCPPVRETVEHVDPAGEASAPFDAGPVTDADAPSTQVMEGAPARSRGKRKPTIREASFATHVDFEKVLSRATPLVPLRAILDDAPEKVEEAAPEPEPPGASTTAMMPPAGVSPSRRAWLIVAGVAAVGVLGWMLVRGKPTRSAGAPADAAVIAPVIADAASIDAEAPDAAPADAPPDAPAAPLDAPARTDAPPRAPPVDAAPAARTGTLKVGADPWGEVFLDGRRLGRAPNAWQVPAGRHQVEVVFPSDEGEVRRRFDVDVPAGGQAAPLFADFTP